MEKKVDLTYGDGDHMKNLKRDKSFLPSYTQFWCRLHLFVYSPSMKFLFRKSVRKVHYIISECDRESELSPMTMMVHYVLLAQGYG